MAMNKVRYPVRGRVYTSMICRDERGREFKAFPWKSLVIGSLLLNKKPMTREEIRQELQVDDEMAPYQSVWGALKDLVRLGAVFETAKGRFKATTRGEELYKSSGILDA